MSKENIDIKRLSKDFCTQWGIDGKKIEEKNREFMEEMDSINFYVLRAEDSGELKLNSYDLPNFYQTMSRAINCYNELFHMIDCTIGWKDREEL